jgi:phenylalanyl-tRNA synthetase alpha chain
MEISELENIKKEVLDAIDQAQKPRDLDLVLKKYLDKEGKLGQFFKSMASFSKEKRAEAGVQANRVKNELMTRLKQRTAELQGAEHAKRTEWTDVTLPGVRPKAGHLHPFTIVERRIAEIFHGMGFEIVESREVENEWYNFDALNIPQEHPARDVFDTLFLGDGALLRAHTSPGQVRYMEAHQPPLRIIVPGRVFRRDAVDASHMPNFYQVEGLMVDKSISVANFKAIIDEFFKQFFADNETDIESKKTTKRGQVRSEDIRLRPSFFPFTEPSFEVDMRCVNCAGAGCPVCKSSGWMEIMGAGMVHPNVLKNSGVDPAIWQGFAFGIGMDRLAMVKYKINDIRLFYGGDQRFLEQF